MENDAYRRYLSGDDSALTDLLKEYSNGLTRYIQGFVKDEDITRELCDEVFVKLVVKKPKFRGDSAFKTYLYAVGRNLAVDHLRKNKTKYVLSLDTAMQYPAATHDPERAFLDKERRDTLDSALSALRPDYERVLRLTYFDGLSARETAAAMNKSVRSVESLLYRARAALRKRLEKEGFVYENI